MRRGLLALMPPLLWAGHVWADDPLRIPDRLPPIADSVPFVTDQLPAAPLSPFVPMLPAEIPKSVDDKAKADLPKDDKAKQDKAKDDKARQDKAKDDKAKQDKAKQDDTPKAPPREAFRLLHEGPCDPYWLQGNVLLWHLRDGKVNNPLLTTAMNQPLIGSQPLDRDQFLGLNVTGGMWLNKCHTYGIETGLFLLEERSGSLGFANGPARTLDTDRSIDGGLVRPITDALRGGSTPFTVSIPGQFAGAFSATGGTRFGGGEMNLVRNLKHDSTWDFALLYGFRYLDLRETLVLRQQTVGLNGNTIAYGGLGADGQPTLVNEIDIEDRFSTRNQFWGGQCGGRLEYGHGPWYALATAKVAIGPNRELIEINGQTSSPGLSSVSSGLLAVAGTNAGQVQETHFAVVPELGIQVGCQVSRHVRLMAGYNFLYISDVVRPGSQVNVNVNPGRVPTSLVSGTVTGPAQPARLNEHDDFIAHGVMLGCEIRY